MTNIVQVNEPSVVVTVDENAVTITQTVSDVTVEVGASGPQGVGVPIGGTAGQILAKDSATDYDTSWIDNFTTDVRKYVKSDYVGTLPKGTVVYISGADGNNALVLPAIATTDGTSANTIGFLAQPLTHNEFGWVIVEGTLTGIDTSAAGAAGDPVWLSGTTAGGVVYGLANKPLAPYHLVFLGTVTRKQANNGSIEISINNGWELDELHNVSAVSPSNNDLLKYNSTTGLWQNAQTITASQISDGSTTFARLAAANAFTVGGHTITNATASDIPLLIKGAASQSVPIFAVQTSDTNNRLRVTSGGNVVANSLTANIDGSVSVAPSAVVGTALIESAAVAGQAYPLVMGRVGTSWVAAINPTGFDSYFQSRFIPINASTIPLYVRGAASQTADLQQWQSSAGSVYLRVDSGGSLFANSTSANYAVGTNVGIKASSASAIPLSIAAATSQTADLTRWYASDGTSLLGKVDPNGTIGINYITNPANTSTASYLNFTATAVGLYSRNAATTSFFVRGAVSQSANLQEWQNDSGGILARVVSSGSIYTAGISVVGQVTAPPVGTQFYILAANATQIGGVIRMAASATADALQVQNNAGTSLTRILPSGSIEVAESATIGITNSRASLNYGTNIFGGTTTGWLRLQSNYTEAVAGASYVLHETDGTTKIVNTRSDLLSKIRFMTNGSGTANTAVERMSIDYQGAVAIDNFAASRVGLTIKGAASQTANLFVLQNSSANSLAFFTASGLLDLSAVSATAPNVVGGAVGDKIALYEDNTNAGYGFGIQNSRIVAYTNGTADAFSVRPKSGTGHKSSGTDAVTLYANGGYASTLTSTTQIGIYAKLAAAHSVNAITIQNSASTTIFGVDANGNTSIGSTLTFANPGVGNETKFVFTKQSDSAQLRVVEHTTDQTFYEFYMADNPTGGDFFQWSMLNYESGSLGWMPIQMGGFTNRHIAQSHVMWGNVLTTVNTPFYTTNNATSTAGGAGKETIKYAPYNSTTYNLQLDLGTGTGTLNVDINGYTGSVQQRYWITMDSTTTFKWGYNWNATTPVATGVAITGAWQLLADGIYVKLSGTGYVTGDTWSWAAFPVSKLSFGGTPLTSTLASFQPAAGMSGIQIKMAASPTQDPFAVQNSSGTKVFRVDTGGNLKTPNIGTTNSKFQAFENNNGAGLIMQKQTAAQGNPGADFAALYFRDGTTAGTLKLVVRAGATGAETTILDNIPQ